MDSSCIETCHRKSTPLHINCNIPVHVHILGNSHCEPSYMVQSLPSALKSPGQEIPYSHVFSNVITKPATTHHPHQKYKSML